MSDMVLISLILFYMDLDPKTPIAPNPSVNKTKKMRLISLP